MSYLVLGVAGTDLASQERAWLAEDSVAGVILFSRNWESPAQLTELTAAVREVCKDGLILVDQEGGRVQRLTDPLTPLPPLGQLGEAWEADPPEACTRAEAHGELMAREVIAQGIDLSLAPVLDLRGPSSVIGDRAFHRSPEAVAELGAAYRRGMRRGGMAACGKHFPGHGSVVPDTHVEDAVDERSWDEIASTDLVPFRQLIAEGLESVMLAHVSYPRICPQPAGYSRTWIQDVLRGQLSFTGVVISDDLGMRAAESAGSFTERIEASLGAGCDLLLVCRPEDVAATMAGPLPTRETVPGRVAALRARPQALDWTALAGSQRHQELKSMIV
ncbi:MAG: beta-N-acetylhexosaminidase [Pseudomonadota bacterium]